MLKEHATRSNMTKKEAKVYYDSLPTEKQADAIFESVSNTIKQVVGNIPFMLSFEFQDGAVAGGNMSGKATIAIIKSIIDGLIKAGVDPRHLMMKLFPLELLLSMLVEDEDTSNIDPM